MSHESAERPRRHADPARPVDEAEGSGTGSGSGLGDAGGGGTAVAAASRPLSRRELRELERRRAAGAAAAEAGTAAVGERVDATPGPVPADRVVAPPDRPQVPAADPAPRMADTVPSDTSRYALVHYLALALVACVLGYLVWSLTTGPAEPDSSSTGPALSTISPSAARTATQGEL